MAFNVQSHNAITFERLRFTCNFLNGPFGLLRNRAPFSYIPFSQHAEICNLPVLMLCSQTVSREVQIYMSVNCINTKTCKKLCVKTLSIFLLMTFERPSQQLKRKKNGHRHWRYNFLYIRV